MLADRQTFDPQRQVVTANGDVLVQFGTDQLAAERLWVNLNNRYLRAEGDVFFNRNEQILEGMSPPTTCSRDRAPSPTVVAPSR